MLVFASMSVIADIAKKDWTEAELQALPEDGFIHEVVFTRSFLFLARRVK